MTPSSHPRYLDLFTRWFGWLADLPRRRRQAIVIGIDAILCVAAVWIAFFLRLGTYAIPVGPVLAVAVAGLLFWFPIAWISGVYLSIIRFSGARALANLVIAGAVFAVPMTALISLSMTATLTGSGIVGVPRTIGLLHPMVFVLLMGLSRLGIRFLVTDVLHIAHGAQVRRVLIYGAGRAGQQLAMSLRHEPQTRVVGFIDDDRRLDGQRLDGVRVFDAVRLADVLKSTRAQEVLLAMPSLSRADRRAIVDRLQRQEVHVRALPSLSSIIDGEVSVSDLRDVGIEDLLGRDPVAPNELLMGKTIAGKRVLVSGAGGSIGSELCRQILRCHPRQLVLVDHSEFALYAIEDELRAVIAADGLACELIPELANVAEASVAMRVFRRWRPETVFHAAAYKHVPLVEANPVSGIRNNVFGTLHSCLAAEATGVQTFILISTDKAVRPTNVMGASKRVCELVLQARAATQSSTVFTMVRFGNVLGSSGSVVPRFKAQIAAGGPVTVTHRDVTRYFMTIPEAAQLVIQAGAMASGGEVFVLDMGQPVRIVDLAETMVHLSGLSLRNAEHPDGDIEIVEVGLRPGEKLYEELLIGNNPQSTLHTRIMRAEEVMVPWPELSAAMDELDQLVLNGDAGGAVGVVEQLVPDFAAVRQRGRAARSGGI